MSFDEVRRLDFENLRELLDRIEGGGVNLPLKRGNIGSVNAGQIRQSFLRQLPFHSDLAQVRREDLTQRHAAKQTAAMTLHPRSIHYIINNKMSAAL